MQPPLRRPEPVDQHDVWNFSVRGESPTQRLDRNYSEILQELRVAQTGAQLLLAFLLTVAFTPKFAEFTDFQRGIYIASLVLGAGFRMINSQCHDFPARSTQMAHAIRVDRGFKNMNYAPRT